MVLINHNTKNIFYSTGKRKQKIYVYKKIRMKVKKAQVTRSSTQMRACDTSMSQGREGWEKILFTSF